MFTNGMWNASLKLKLAATENIGSTQLKRAPINIIFPVCGSSGNLAKWKPRGVRFSSASMAFRFSSNYAENTIGYIKVIVMI